jgi:WD40 repeat protein
MLKLLWRLLIIGFVCVQLEIGSIYALQVCEVISGDNIEALKPLNELQFPKTDQYGSPVTDIEWMPNSEQFAVATGSDGLSLYDLSNINNPQILDQEPVYRVAFDPTGQGYATISDNNIQIHSQDVPILIETELDQLILTVIFSLDGTKLYGLSPDTIFVWDVTTGAEIQRYEVESEFVTGPGVSAVFSPDGTKLITFKHDKLIVRDPTSLTVISSRTMDDFILDLVPNPNSDFLAASMLASTLIQPVVLLDADTLETLKTLPTSVNLLEVAFSPDGSLLVASINQGFLVWDAVDKNILSDRAAPIRAFSNHVARHISVEFSSNGKYLMSAGLDEGKVIVWGIC